MTKIQRLPGCTCVVRLRRSSMRRFVALVFALRPCRFSGVALELVKLVIDTRFCARLGIWRYKRMAGTCGLDRGHRPCFSAVAGSWSWVLSEPGENRYSQP